MKNSITTNIIETIKKEKNNQFYLIAALCIGFFIISSFFEIDGTLKWMVFSYIIYESAGNETFFKELKKTSHISNEKNQLIFIKKKINKKLKEEKFLKPFLYSTLIFITLSGLYGYDINHSYFSQPYISSFINIIPDSWNIYGRSLGFPLLLVLIIIVATFISYYITEKYTNKNLKEIVTKLDLTISKNQLATNE